jgi:DNA replication protein DnaD
MIAPIIKAWEKSDGHLPEVHKAAIKVAFEYNNKYKNFKILKIGG